jgi:putative hydrolase of the HAD superfamily
VKALLVDLDDTLLDYSGGVEDSWQTACQALAPTAGLDAIALADAVRIARRWFWDDVTRQRTERMNMMGAWAKIAANGLERVGAPSPELAARIAEDFAARRWAVMRLFPGVPEALGRLCASGVPMALVTNGDKSQQRRKIEQFDLAGFFDVIVIEGEFGVGKPEEIVYRHALECLGIAPTEAWMVGDHIEWDVAAPQRLGLRGIWVDRERTGLPEGAAVRPHRIVREFCELLDPTPSIY